MNLRNSALTLTAAGALGLSAFAMGCGGSDSTSSTAADSDEDATTTTSVAASGPAVKVDMGEFFYKPEALTAKAGGVEIDAANIGKTVHELVVAKTDDAPDKLPTASDGSVDEESLDVPGEIADVAPNSSGTATLDLQPGKYVIFCNLPGHYASGMYGSLTVK